MERIKDLGKPDEGELIREMVQAELQVREFTRMTGKR